MPTLSNLKKHRQEALTKAKETMKQLYPAQKCYDHFIKKHRKALYNFHYIDRKYMEEKVRIRNEKNKREKTSKPSSALTKALKAIQGLPKELQEKIIKEMEKNYGKK